ncbi:hypothetical protein [Streptomyces antibioticus]|uniref:hypothetical protein n=1 Tax=Streptomyces antibioticus TaxID=1890 RepID=UPI003D739C04
MSRFHLGDHVDSGVDRLVTHPSRLYDVVRTVVEGREQDAVRTWLKEHPGLVEKWVPVAESGEKSGAGR